MLTEVTNARASVGASRPRRSSSTIRSRSRNSSRRRGELHGALSRLLRRRRELSAAQVRRAVPRPAPRSSKAPRTGSPSRATATSSRCRSSTRRCAQFPTNLTAMLFKMDVKPNFTVENEAAISAPPKVDFDKAPAATPRRRAASPGTPASAPGDPRRSAEEGLLTRAGATRRPAERACDARSGAARHG